MNSIEIVKTEVLSEQKSRLEKVTYKKAGADDQLLDREVYHRPNATTILLYDPSRRKVLLTKQVRIPVFLQNKSGDLLEACAGLIDEGEFPEHSVIREVEEETGYRISQVQKIAEAFSSPGAFSEYVHFFLGEYSPELKVNEGGGLAHEGEDISIVELSYEEARQMLFSGQIHDAKTIILLQHAVINNII